MKIKQIRVSKKDLRLTRPYTIAYKTISAVENGIIELVSDSGVTGLGSLNPVVEVTGETLEQALGALGADGLGWLEGRRIDTIEEFKAIIKTIRQKTSASSSARAGLEMALYDLFTQSLDLPLVKFLGQKIRRMPTSVTIGIKDMADTLLEAKEYTGRGFKILKIKLGVSPEADLERLTKLREVYGNKIGLIVDINQGYNLQQLLTFCDKVKNMYIPLIEQPLKAGQEATMQQLPRPVKRLLAADESLLTPRDALKLAESPAACGFFNIKLMKCGGITEALEIAAIAARSGIGLMWGCNDESRISIAAALHTAFSCSQTRYIDLDGSFDLAEDVVAGGFILKDGMMSLRDKPGLGLEKAF